MVCVFVSVGVVFVVCGEYVYMRVWCVCVCGVCVVSEVCVFV